MPQGSPGQGRAMPQGRLSRGLNTFLSTHIIGNTCTLVFTIIFDTFNTYQVSVYMLVSYQFSFLFFSKNEDDEMYEDLEEISPKIAIFDPNTSKIKSLKQNLLKISLEYLFMLNTMLLFILL